MCIMSCSRKDQKKILCKYFLNHVCKAKENCPFSHDPSNSIKDNRCKFYLLGNCNYGKNCRYDHVKQLEITNQDKPVQEPTLSQKKPTILQKPQSPPPSESSSSVSCSTFPTPSNNSLAAVHLPISKEKTLEEEYIQFYYDYEPPQNFPVAKNYFPINPEVSYNQILKKNIPPTSDEKTSPESNTNQPDDADEILPTENNLSFCENLSVENHLKLEDLHLKDISQPESITECGICLEIIPNLSTPQKNSIPRFGLLSGCWHSFCLQCIREWRSKDVSSRSREDLVRSCPLCREISHYIIPSYCFPSNQEEKDQILESYKAVCKRKPCKYFRKQPLAKFHLPSTGTDDSQCPFGSSCWYQHLDPDGKEHIYQKPRLVYGDVSSEQAEVAEAEDPSESSIKYIQTLRFQDFFNPLSSQ
eukprot:Sdes_comp20686_c0_seq1m16219